jgi:peptidyl-prolyl cis-trans isomerase C
MMNRALTLLLSVSVLAATGCDQLQSPRQPTATATAAEDAAPQGLVLARVNGSPITQPVFEVYAAQRKSQQQHGGDTSKEAILNELISLELMRQESTRKGLDTQPDIMATLEQQKRTVLAGAAIRQFMEENPIADDAVREMYDTQIGKPSTEYNARHILVKTREEAEEIIKQLDAGADFAELAKEKSTGPSGASGGKLGWFAPAQMVPQFSEATAKLAKGSYTEEPVETQFGWHVILLEDSRESTPPSFEEVKDRLKVLAANQQLQQHIQQIRESANIEITAE